MWWCSSYLANNWYCLMMTLMMMMMMMMMTTMIMMMMMVMMRVMITKILQKLKLKLRHNKNHTYRVLRCKPPAYGSDPSASCVSGIFPFRFASLPYMLCVASAGTIQGMCVCVCLCVFVCVGISMCVRTSLRPAGYIQYYMFLKLEPFQIRLLTIIIFQIFPLPRYLSFETINNVDLD